MFTLFTGRHLGGSILGSVILCGAFPRISRLWNNAHTLNLENCLLYLSSTISLFFLLYPLHSFWFYFLLRDSAHTIVLLTLHLNTWNPCILCITSLICMQYLCCTATNTRPLLIPLLPSLFKLFSPCLLNVKFSHYKLINKLSNMHLQQFPLCCWTFLAENVTKPWWWFLYAWYSCPCHEGNTQMGFGRWQHQWLTCRVVTSHLSSHINQFKILSQVVKGAWFSSTGSCCVI